MNLDYSQFFHMMPEVTLMAMLVIVFIIDFATAHKAPIVITNDKTAPSPRPWFNPLVCAFMLIHILLNCCPTEPATAFGGMYATTPMIGVLKTILAFGTLIVFIQARTWLSRPDSTFKEGEFYMLIISTLLGMNMMVSADHFLLFFLGLDTLPATLSSGVMLYGLTFIYADAGSLYFNEVSQHLSATPMTVMGMVFFFSGLGFKISLVPFHFWTADTYQGAPTTITGYLSVVSKGAAAFALCSILMHVFGVLLEQWQYLLGIVIVLSITIANLFAIRQTELKRFMAFSSISQAGYIMLAVMGDSGMGVTALTYYILVYVVANMSVFTIISAIEERNNGVTDMDAYNGLYSTNPKLAFLMTLALFSLGGIPPFAGMFSKFFVFMAALEQGSAWAYLIVFIALINTVISLYYYLLIVKAMYINKSENPLPAFKSDCNTRVALAICTLGVALFGVCSYVYDWIFAAL